ncbi:hypothetical protein VPH35_014324 [Triticum aestivum]|uniref:uncharacterized protein n=1 Tax=Triticum aestivum TaxID=4565 RepID=UPI001D007671|nr:uncharacterized protein LOC123167930 [Triticum aestivum]XP_044441732.1 uncharacterized protein LOC123167930 [Triticum aestivum]
MEPDEVHRMSLLQLAKRQLFEPDTNLLYNPVIREQLTPQGNPEYSRRGWTSGRSFIAQCYYPVAPHPRVDTAVTLGTHMISKGLGWEFHEVEYSIAPPGYVEWGTNILKNYSMHLKGSEENTDYIYGAIYCSLGEYSVSPPLLRALLEHWDPNTNTFLFPCGERIMTLLDMNQMAGLPLDGDPYEEFIPPTHELDPSLLLYPSFLPQLLDIWNKLSESGNVGFREWCDYFHNRLNDTFFINSLQDERLYTAAYITIWLCRFVVPGGGPYIRPGVLVMASWITIGRRISLAPPALCSLYYSLRLISTHPIGPSFLKRAWQVHYLIGWIGIYLRKVFGNKSSTKSLPFYKHPAPKPKMWNTV